MESVREWKERFVCFLLLIAALKTVLLPCLGFWRKASVSDWLASRRMFASDVAHIGSAFVLADALHERSKFVAQVNNGADARYRTFPCFRSQYRIVIGRRAGRRRKRRLSFDFQRHRVLIAFASCEPHRQYHKRTLLASVGAALLTQTSFRRQ